MKDRYSDYHGELKDSSKYIFSQVEEACHGGWVLDVGSNTGSFIECVLDRFPSTNVLGFEPVRRYYANCRKRFRKRPNVRLENMALSDRQGRHEIFVARKNIGWNTMVAEKVDEDNEGRSEWIQCLRFDSYYFHRGLSRDKIKFDVVKIDVEGWEYKVLRGMRRFLQSQMPVIVCEIGWGRYHPHWREELKEFEYLCSIGYNREVLEQIKVLEGTTDVVFRPMTGAGVG